MAVMCLLRPALARLALVAVLLFLAGACTRETGYREPPQIGSEAAIDVKLLQPGVPLFFTHLYRGKKISFFVVKADNRILSFLDACARCYTAKRGYRFEEGYLLCKECGVKYGIGDIEKGMGGCFPIRVEGCLRGGTYFIPLSALEESADKF